MATTTRLDSGVSSTSIGSASARGFQVLVAVAVPTGKWLYWVTLTQVGYGSSDENAGFALTPVDPRP